MPYRDAKALANDRNLDLVQVNKDNTVHVYKIMDYGKFKYEQKKHKQKKTSHPLKEMSFKVRIDPHDMNIKINRIKSFLSKGSDVKITVTMRGRERASPRLAEDKLNEILAALGDLAQVQQRRSTNSSVFVSVKPSPGKKNHERRSESIVGNTNGRDENTKKEVDQETTAAHV